MQNSDSLAWIQSGFLQSIKITVTGIKKQTFTCRQITQISTPYSNAITHSDLSRYCRRISLRTQNIFIIIADELTFPVQFITQICMRIDISCYRFTAQGFRISGHIINCRRCGNDLFIESLNARRI